MWNDLSGAQISAVKQPYAYFNKELVQQIDASEVGVWLEPRSAWACHSPRGLLPGKAEAAEPGAIPHPQIAGWRTQGRVQVSASFPELGQKVPWAGAASVAQT